MIKFTKHANQKFKILRLHNFHISKKEVIKAIQKPELIDYSRLPLLIAQRKLDRNHVLRVVYREEDGDKLVITFYPGRIKHYEKRKKPQ